LQIIFRQNPAPAKNISCTKNLTNYIGRTNHVYGQRCENNASAEKILAADLDRRLAKLRTKTHPPVFFADDILTKILSRPSEFYNFLNDRTAILEKPP